MKKLFSPLSRPPEGEFTPDGELLLSLELMHKGCTAVLLDTRPVFILKGPPAEMDAYSDSSEALVTFECVVKTELAGIRCDVQLRRGDGDMQGFYYFFDLESPDDSAVLGALRGQMMLYLIFLGAGVGAQVRKIELSPARGESLDAVMDEARRAGLPVPG